MDAQLSHVEAEVTFQTAQGSSLGGVVIYCNGRWKQKVETFPTGTTDAVSRLLPTNVLLPVVGC